jgi:hypothetical protein
LAIELHEAAAVMTRFDQLWEPLAVVIVAAALWFGTL